jgi:hypothetical protein
MNTGMQFTKPQPASMICSTYHFVACSEPTGRYETTTSVRVSLEHLRDVDGRARRLGDPLRQVLAEAVMGHAALHLDAQRGDLAGEVDRVVLAGEDRLREVLADLLAVDVERCGELDVAHVVAAEIDVHQPGTCSAGSASL